MTLENNELHVQEIIEMFYRQMRTSPNSTIVLIYVHELHTSYVLHVSFDQSVTMDFR